MPDLSAGIIMNAFAYLNLHYVVIGLAEDSGYYLLVMKQFYPALFENVIWSTGRVLDETVKKCAAFTIRLLLVTCTKRH
ncbi:MAG: DUF2064 domain-containing protein [Chitinophagales bacterium]|nr:DUF2064 domain-containing protein [Chitinophagales bacterium]